MIPGEYFLRSDRVPRMVREMMDTLTRILPRLKLAPAGGPKRREQTSQPVPAA